MKKKELKKAHKMNIRHFLQSYCELDNSELVKKLSRLHHKELKIISKSYNLNLQTINFEDVTREMLLTGEIIIVEDYYGNPAPYINPSLNFEDEFNSYLNQGDENNVKYKRR